MSTPEMGDLTDVTKAALDMLRRTGLKSLSIAYQDETTPIAWVAVGEWETGHLIGADFDADRAIFDLVEKAVDAGECQHCHRPTGITTDIDAMPMAHAFCWYQFDPELKTFRRGCEGQSWVRIEDAD